MSVGGAGVGGAFALGFALGAAPGPVQLLILSETAKRGLEGGLRVMLGANLTLFGILLILALGFASLEPKTERGGMRGSLEITKQVLARLAALEKDWFDARQ